MPIRVGILSAAHMHVHSYARALMQNSNAEVVGVWDSDPVRASSLASSFGFKVFSDRTALVGEVDAVVVASENSLHLENVQAAAGKGKHVLCEKPLICNEADADAMRAAAREVKVMTAFPCRYSPAFQRLKQRVAAGDIGRLLAVCATNHGMCPMGWFVQPDLSGGGAMMDHTVHVADLLRDLLGGPPISVYAQSASLIHGQKWDDAALLQFSYANGVFATLDASWSRPGSYKTWGDVTMNVVGDGGVIELDMFGQGFDKYANGHATAGYGSDLDAALVGDFLKCITENLPPPISCEDGLGAAQVAFAGYKSAASGQPVLLSA